ncbi:NAD(P)-binding protein [Pseudoalteromonas sp. JBTF-M23]|uniref:NAD(P)-binding protein n=1 Tax=Pseudoalteromonas caenipelagi TaxID=2726988 RepID=A0A849VF17_9GAMM|nr:FAD-dependent monooxygenase [Pseudoalteromonas caenipelagi]NOU50301.1 NAD(P)-binding protein [Pseudoalteromonas caenipelagi]
MKIAILGGGVAGLSTAIALKLKGFDCHIYERHSATSDMGAGVVCWPNACFVLDKLGVLDNLSKVSGLITTMKRIDQDNEILGSLDITKLNKLMHYPSYAVLRKDLMKILETRCKELAIPIHFKHQITFLSKHKTTGQTLVHFNNGKHITPDVIIGAEGRMNSLTRQFVHGNNQPVFQGFINWIGVYQSDTPCFDEMSVYDYWGVGKRFGLVPTSNKTAYWAGGIAIDNIDLSYTTHVKQRLLDYFVDWPPITCEVIARAQEDKIKTIFVHDHDPIDTWYKDNVLLIGDAAHAPLPTSGQGACQALEDAWHLANCLSSKAFDIKTAFKQFNTIRSSKTANITMLGRQLAQSIFNIDPQFCEQRNENAKSADLSQLISGMANGFSSGLPILNG